MVGKPKATDGDQDFRTVARMRLGIGLIGLLLPIAIPIVLMITTMRLDGNGFPDSMSASYYTHARNIFVGGMCAIGVFLIGYRRSRVDNWMSNFAGLFALGVALFPTSKPGSGDATDWTARVHTGSAIGLLVLLGMFCVWRFPNGIERGHVLLKDSDRIYIGCGVGMAACAALELADQFGYLSGWTVWPSPLYVSESVAVLLFGVAWLLKGWNLGHALRAGSVPLAPPQALMPPGSTPVPPQPQPVGGPAGDPTTVP